MAEFGKKARGEARNLVALRELVAGLEDGSVSADVYRTRIEDVVRTAEQGVQVMKTPSFQAKVAEWAPAEQELSNRTAALMAEALEGYRQMRSGHPDDVRQGLETVERTFVELDKVRRSALRMAEG